MIINRDKIFKSLRHPNNNENNCKKKLPCASSTSLGPVMVDWFNEINNNEIECDVENVRWKNRNWNRNLRLIMNNEPVTTVNSLKTCIFPRFHYQFVNRLKIIPYLWIEGDKQKELSLWTRKIHQKNDSEKMNRKYRKTGQRWA